MMVADHRGESDISGTPHDESAAEERPSPLRLPLNRHGWSIGTVVLGAVGLAVYFGALSSVAARDVTFVAFGIAATLGIAAGVRLHRPAVPGPWLWWLAASASYTIAQVAYWYQEVVVGSLAPFPSVTDVFMLARYPLLTVGLLVAVRARVPGRDRNSLVDGLITATAAGSLAIVLFEPSLRAADAGIAMRVTAIGFPILSLLVVAVTTRMLVGTRVRGPAARLVTVAVLVDLAATITYAALAFGGRYETGHPVDAGLLMAPLLWAAAAMHPSMRDMTNRAEPRPSRWQRWRVALPGCAVMATPTVMAVDALRGGPGGAPTLAAIGSGLVGVLVVVRLAFVIADLRARTADIQEREAQYRALVEHARDVVFRFRLGEDPGFDYISPSVEDITGHTPADMEGDGNLPFRRIRRSDWPKLEATMTEAGPDHVSHVVQWTRPDGRTVWLEQNAMKVRDEDGRLVAVEGIIRDVTDRVEDRRRLERMNRELMAANEVRDEFLARASHELRTPLTPLMGFIELLQKQWDLVDRPQRERVLASMERQSTRMLLLVDDLLTTTHLHSGEIVSHPEAGAIAPVIHDVLTRFADHGVDVACDAGTQVLADFDHLRHVLTNLVRNAVTYGEPPYAVVVDELDGNVRVIVHDAGDGVPAHLHDTLFESFTQADQGDTRTSKGVGLGLAVSRGLAELNDGDLAYEHDDSGTRFVLRLPSARTVPAESPR